MSSTTSAGKRAHAKEPAPTLLSLPEEILDRVFKFNGGEGKNDGELDFVLTTATLRNCSEPTIPLQSTSVERDVIVRGVPVGGVLYVTKVYGLLPEGTYCPTRASPGRGDSDVEKQEWYGCIRREKDSKPLNPNDVNHQPVVFDDGLAQDAWPIGPSGKRVATKWAGRYGSASYTHLFWADDWTRALYISSTKEDIKDVVRQHKLRGLTDINAEFDTNDIKSKMMSRLQTRCNWRSEDITGSQAAAFLRLPNGRVNRAAGHKGSKLLLGLCKNLKIYLKNEVIATLPIMSRISMPSPNDELLNMNEIKHHLQVDHDKWFACVPIDWVFAWQSKLEGFAPFGERTFSKVDSLKERIDAMNVGSEGDNGLNVPNTVAKLIKRKTPSNAMLSRDPIQTHAEQKMFEGTSFEKAAAMLNAVFIAHGGSAFNLHDPECQEQLLQRAEQTRFFMKYRPGGPLLRDVPRGGIARFEKPNTDTVKKGKKRSIFGGSVVMV